MNACTHSSALARARGAQRDYEEGRTDEVDVRATSVFRSLDDSISSSTDQRVQLTKRSLLSIAAVVCSGPVVGESLHTIAAGPPNMSVVDRLRQNDPARTSIPHLFQSGNLGCGSGTGTGAESVRHGYYIGLGRRAANRLEFFAACDCDACEPRKSGIAGCSSVLRKEMHPPSWFAHILRAMQQNTSIRFVKLWWLRLPNNISTFVDTASSITSFSLHDCDMETRERQQGARILRQHFSATPTSSRLKLNELEDIYTIPILEGLRSNVSVKTLIFSPPLLLRTLSDAVSHALQELLESTTSIQRFEFHNATFSEIPFAQLLKPSHAVNVCLN